jgi:hypothetical protein
MSTNSGSSEYQRLYTLLSSLSSKTRAGPEPPIVPMISIFEDNKRSNRSNKTARHKRNNDDYKEIPKEPPKEIPAPLPAVKEEIKEEPPKRKKPIIGDLDDPIDNALDAKKRAKAFECSGCFKRYRTKADLETHYGMTEMCKRWMALPNHEEYGTPALPIHMFLDELLTQSITGDKPLQCRFCKTTFVNRGNHHKHFYNAYVCNRLAFAECKQLLQTLQIEQRK